MTDAPGSRNQPDPDPIPDPSSTEAPTPAPATPVGAPAPEPGAFAESLAAAARRAGFTPAAEGEAISGRALLAAMGGIRGLVEAVLPGLVFLATYTFTRQLVPALVAPVAIGLVFAGLRVAAKQTVTQAVGGLVGIGISAVLALFTGKAEDFYLPGFWTNGGYAAVLLISIAVGWPLVGLAVGFLMGDGIAWRSDPSRRRVLTILTGCWAAMFVLRLAVQLPLYYSGNVEWLGATKLLMGIPLYAPLLVLSWLMVRSVYRPTDAAATDPGTPGTQSATGEPGH